jgi:hypothetical protein
MRRILKDHGVGPDAGPAPKPAPRPRDWLDDILDTPPTPQAPAPQKPEPAPKATAPKPTAAPAKNPKKKPRRRRPTPNTPRSAFDSRPPSPRQSLVEAWDRVPWRLKWLTYHASAAYLGWSVGLVGWVTYVTAWTANGHLASPQAIFWYATGASTLLLHHTTRSRWWPVAWLCAVPATSTVVGVLLYGTPHP